MIFNTWAFGCFALMTVAAYVTIVPTRAKPVFLIVIGCVFYAYAVPAYLVFVAALGATTYGIGRALLHLAREKTGERRTLLAIGIGLPIAALVFFKDTPFFATIVDHIARSHVVPLPHLIVPLAISFFTFEFVHVLVDVDAGRIKRLDARDFAVFALFFPTLVAGPIKRYQTFAPQIRAITPCEPARFALNLYRIALGLAKKTVVADAMGAFTVPLAHPGAPYGRVDYLVAALAYAVRIYFDFSGYSDIAIGLAGLLGFRVPENFTMPYRARSVSEFWRRWHVSLSTWVRDYVFVPLGGSRRGPLRTSLNLLFAMGLVGFWHGAAWTFVAWGLWHGIGLGAHRLWTTTVVSRVAWLRADSPSLRALSVAATFAFTTTGWVFFASPSLADAALILRNLFA